MIYQAMTFAREKHATQRRKYSGAPYVEHLAEVAALTHAFGGDETAVACAWLHDVIEDQGVSVEELEAKFGADVARIVWSLSHQEIGSRETRHLKACERLSAACPRAHLIKACDIISNTKSVEGVDPGFADMYLSEKSRQLVHLRQAPVRALNLARECIRESNEWLYENAPNARYRG